ncbi:hypothetical protein [uncultured Shimia sp.]|uniref:hypothetical protein n=1 Tax=uncultured Shimia sp. TaxID=573152 RepID=UPI0026041A28|nr:hypothetical protein [uncultured Shimia sp.]
MKALIPSALIASATFLTGCMGVDGQYSDPKIAAQNGFPELALQLGRLRSDCVLQAADWEPVFIRNKITTASRVSNTLTGMQQNGQIIFFQDKRVIAVTADYCGK